MKRTGVAAIAAFNLTNHLGIPPQAPSGWRSPTGIMANRQTKCREILAGLLLIDKSTPPTTRHTRGRAHLSPFCIPGSVKSFREFSIAPVVRCDAILIIIKKKPDENADEGRYCSLNKIRRLPVRCKMWHIIKRQPILMMAYISSHLHIYCMLYKISWLFEALMLILLNWVYESYMIKIYSRCIHYQSKGGGRFWDLLDSQVI